MNSIFARKQILLTVWARIAFTIIIWNEYVWSSLHLALAFFFDCHIDLFIYDQLEALLRIWFYDTVPILRCKFTFWSLFMTLSLGSALVTISKQFTVSSILKSNPSVSGNFPLNDGGLTWPWFYLQSGAPNEKIIQNHLIKHIIVKCILVFKQWI